jgi:molybdopterin-guanine dinucleotide biosynthesis protein A
MPPVHAGLLVGGDSGRMGQPKQLLDYDGATFIERVRSAIEPHVARIVLLGEGAVPESCRGLPRLPDAPQTGGPLAGMLAALRSAPDAAWLIAACDLPRITPEAIRWLLEQRAPDRWAVLPRVAPDRAEPLLAVYEPTSRPLLNDLLKRGRSAPRELASYAQVHTPTPPADLLPAWQNVNTPADFHGLEP